jgi:hypothetical protein
MSRKFSNLRRPTRTADKEITHVAAAFAKIAMQPEGQLILNWMRNRTTFLVLPPDAPDGALRGNAANRQLMQEIENMIADGGRTKSDGK